MLNILITGGTGRLATELKKHLEGEYVSIENFDIAYDIPDKKYDIVLHLAAYTAVVKAETEYRRCFDTNVIGTYNLVKRYRDTPFIYISTEYANKPLGVYALTKRLGEEIVKTHSNYLILRTSFKPTPWPFPFAYEDQWTQGDYVDVVAELLAQNVKMFNPETSTLPCKIEYLGTGRKTILALAQRTRPDVVANKVDEYNTKIGVNLIPHDYQD